MPLLPITLGVKRAAGTQGGGVGGGKALSRAQITKKAEATLARDDFSCRYCGFHAKKYQKAMPKDWAATFVTADTEMVTACIFCEQCFLLDQVAGMASGTLIWLPEISQAKLNHMMRSIYVLRAKSQQAANSNEEATTDTTSIRQAAEHAFEVLLARRGEAKKRLGTDSTSVLASTLLEQVSDAVYAKRATKLEGLRLLAFDKRVSNHTDQFPTIAAHWVTNAYATLPPESWAGLLKKL